MYAWITSLTGEQRVEFDQIKAALGATSDGAVIKRALAYLSRAVLVDGRGNDGPAETHRER